MTKFDTESNYFIVLYTAVLDRTSVHYSEHGRLYITSRQVELKERCIRWVTLHYDEKPKAPPKCKIE